LKNYCRVPKILHGLLTNKKKRIATQKICGDTPFPPHYEQKRGVFSKVVETLNMTSDGLEMFEGDSADFYKISVLPYLKSVLKPW
jgi:hypothetical protein